MKINYFLKYIIFCLILISISQLAAQTEIREAGEEPYPAPAMYDNLTAAEAQFIALFDDKNVGNTHVYVPKKGEKIGDHEPYGSIITNSYETFLPTEMQRMVHIKGSEPRALYSIRGGDGELYVIQSSDLTGKQQIGLYALNKEKVVKVKDLATLDCDVAGCTQMDSWLQDIDGDTHLNIIQKSVDGKGNMQTVTYRIQSSGDLEKDDELTINEADYMMYDHSAKSMNSKVKN